MPSRQNPTLIERARELRARQTEAELLLWQVLRGRRLCGLKFRRQYPIDPFITDFACIQRRLVIELDGEYHEYVEDQDLSRQEKLAAKGWRVIRFKNEEVLADVNSVALAIASYLGIENQLPS